MGSNPPVPPPDHHLHPPPGKGGPGHASVPEILPPAHGYVNEFGGQGFTQPPPRPRRRWPHAPATYVLLGINCAVFLLMFLSGAGPFNPDPESLLRWGANNPGAVLYGGQWIRIVTAMFVHGGFLHLALNMWCLWNLGMLAEPLIGSLGVFAAYILTGAAGNLLSTLVNWFSFRGWETPYTQFGPVGVGASGAVFGIAGALIVLLKSTRLPVPPEELKKLRRSVIYFAAINLVIGFSINAGSSRFGGGIAVDNMAHLGGCACGLLFGAPLVPRIGSPRGAFQLRRRISVGIVTVVLVLFGFFLAQLPR